MSADTNPSSWPDPPPTESPKPHWVVEPSGEVVLGLHSPAESRRSLDRWVLPGGATYTDALIKCGFRYFGPCLTPSEIAAREAAAAVAMREMAAVRMARLPAERTVGDPCQMIRALPLPAAAQAALDAVVKEAVMREREACAAIAEDKALPAPWTPQHEAAKQFGLTIAAAIRARAGR